VELKMSAFNLQRIIVILIIVTLSASSFIGLANSTAAEPESRGGAATRAGPETYMVYSSGGTQVYYVPFTGTSFGAPQLLSNQAEEVITVTSLQISIMMATMM
jgi:hypothetical protein